MMRLRTYDHRHAEAVLNGNLRLKKQIERTLGRLQLAVPPSGHPGAPRLRSAKKEEICSPHRQVQRAFLRHGWRAESLVSPRTARRHYFDLFQQRVAIEIEFSNRELLYRDYWRFLLAQSEDRLDVGIIILLDAEVRYVHPWGLRNGLPRLEDAADDLRALSAQITVPIWLIALS